MKERLPTILAAKAFQRLAARLPVAAALWAGGALGSLSYRLASRSVRANSATFRQAGESLAALAIARRLSPAALCRRLRLDGWEHLKAAEAPGRGSVLLAAPFDLGAFALLPIGLYRGHVDVLPATEPRTDLILTEPGDGFGLRLLSEEPSSILSAGGRLGAIFDPTDLRPFEIARQSGASLVPLTAVYREERYRLNILPPLSAAHRQSQAASAQAIQHEVGEIFAAEQMSWGERSVTPGSEAS